MLGSFTDDQWKAVYRKAYDELKPGGWIEHYEVDVRLRTDNHSIPANSPAFKWIPILNDCALRMGHRVALL